MKVLTSGLPGGGRLSAICSRAERNVVPLKARLLHRVRAVVFSFAPSRYRNAPKCEASSNNAIHLTVRPVTRLALSAPRPHSPHGRAQAARPSRPAGDRGR